MKRRCEDRKGKSNPSGGEEGHAGDMGWRQEERGGVAPLCGQWSFLEKRCSEMLVLG